MNITGNLKRLLLILVLLFPSYAFAAEMGMMRLGLIDGDVQIYTSDAGDWAPASINTPVKEEDRLWVPQRGKAEVQVRGNAVIRLAGNTSFDVVSLDDAAAQFYQEKGHSYLNNGRGGLNQIQVDTPLSSVSLDDNAIIMVDVSDDGATEVSVLKGYVYAESRNGKTRVSAGNSIHIGEDLYAEISPIGKSDDWEKWNRERDRKIYGAAESSRYLPDELDPYASDFDDYGRWSYTPDYGYVWRPIVTVSVGWSPYRIGRWVWIGGDYVWISYEPWGWAPYHYGRWAFVSGIGWCWIPPLRGEVYWGPGFVGWVYTPAYVSWVPLAPGDIYYGYGQFGPSSINIINVNIQQIIIKRDFRNIKARNAIIIISRDSFISGKKREFRTTTNPFVTERISAGPPHEIKPERATRMPVIRQIAPSSVPPGKIRQMRVEEIKRDRTFIREKPGSVFRKDETGTEPMPLREMKEPKKVIQREFNPAPSPPPRKKVIEEEKRPQKKEAPVRPETMERERKQKGTRGRQFVPAQPGQKPGVPQIIEQEKTKKEVIEEKKTKEKIKKKPEEKEGEEKETPAGEEKRPGRRF